jgi:hypothetical protein
LFGSGLQLRELGYQVCGWLLGLLIIILLWPNVKITYLYRRADGKMRKKTQYKRVFTPSSKKIKIKVKDADSYEIVFSRWLTRTMRSGSLTLQPEHVLVVNPLIDVPDDAKNRFTSSFIKTK